MNAGELRAPASFAWFLFFVPGAVLVIASIVRLQIDGTTLIGAVLLVIWAWLIGAFTREFWVADVSPQHPDALDSLDIAERAAWERASHLFDQTDIDAAAAKAPDVA